MDVGSELGLYCLVSEIDVLIWNGYLFVCVKVVLVCMKVSEIGLFIEVVVVLMVMFCVFDVLRMLKFFVMLMFSFCICFGWMFV